MKILIDSSVFVSMFFDAETFHERAKSVYEKMLLKEIDAIVSTIEIPEICGAVARKFGKKDWK